MKKALAAGAIALLGLLPACSSDDDTSSETESSAPAGTTSAGDTTAGDTTAAGDSREALQARAEEMFATVRDDGNWDSSWSFLAPSCRDELESAGFRPEDLAGVMNVTYTGTSGDPAVTATVDGHEGRVDARFPSDPDRAMESTWAFEDGRWGTTDPCVGPGA